jgi:hypothetical protein
MRRPSGVHRISVLNQSATSIECDTHYAPEILICRFNSWPSLQEQNDLRARLIKDGHFQPHTSAVLDIRKLHDFPNPDRLADALAQAVGQNTVLRRVACVVETIPQTRFVESLAKMAPRRNVVAPFVTQDEALKWIMESVQ